MHNLYSLLIPGISDQDSRQKFEAAIQEVVRYANDIQRTQACTTYIHFKSWYFRSGLQTELRGGDPRGGGVCQWHSEDTGMHNLYSLLNPGISDQNSRQKFEAAIQEVVGYANDIQRTQACTTYIHFKSWYFRSGLQTEVWGGDPRGGGVCQWHSEDTGMHNLYSLLNLGISDQDSKQKFEAAIQEVVGYANDIQRTQASTAYIHVNGEQIELCKRPSLPIKMRKRWHIYYIMTKIIFQIVHSASALHFTTHLCV